jgi:hypothetical protein
VVGVRDQCGHRHSTLGPHLQLRFDLGTVEPKMTMSTLFLAFLMAVTSGATPS